MAVLHPPAEVSQVVSLLLDPGSYVELPQTVDLLETHISWLFVTDHFVYKLKKPVRFDFLDFTTREARHRACLDEYRLNCRLSPDVYLGVLPIARTPDGRLELAGCGEPLDWVVQMRRLPADAALDHRLRTSHVSGEDVSAIADCLVAFYRRLPRDPIRGDEYRALLERHVRSNAAAYIKQVSRNERDRVRRVVGQQLRFLRTNSGLVDSRAKLGNVVEGHGDLRPEHIYLETPPAIIDCIEFSAELRRVDVLDDLSFLAMECDRLGACNVGMRIVAACQRARNDQIPCSLLSFYKSYRALVRAKTSMLRAAELPDTDRHPLLRQAHQYLDWAEHYSAQLGPPTLIVVGGFMGTGKSTLARRIARAIGANVVSTDHIRRTLYGASRGPASYGTGNYTAERRAQVYEQLFNRAADLLDGGHSVVLDGTFLNRALRLRAASVARKHGGVPLFVRCSCPRGVVLSRLAARAAQNQGVSEGRADLLDEQVVELEPCGDELPSIIVETTLPMDEMVEQVFRALACQSAYA
jgi:uncharacterized protein